MVGILQVQNQNWVLRGIAVFWQTVTNIIEHAAKAGCAREKGENGETGEDWRFEEAFIKCLKSIKKRFLWLNYWTQFWRCKGIYKSSTWNVKRQNFDFQCLLVLYFGNKLVTEKKECSRISLFLVLFPPKTSKCFCKNIHRSNFLTAFFCHRCACDFNKSFLCVQFSFFPFVTMQLCVRCFSKCSLWETQVSTLGTLSIAARVAKVLSEIHTVVSRCVVFDGGRVLLFGLGLWVLAGWW